MKIYLVYGTVGSYDERREWLICAYNNKKMAEKHAELANIKSTLVYNLYSQCFDYEERQMVLKTCQNEYDPDMCFDGESPNYGYYEIDLFSNTHIPHKFKVVK